MIYEITFRIGADGEPETVIIEAEDETRAIMLLGYYRGKRAVKRIKEIKVLGFSDQSNPIEEFMVLR